MARRLRFIPPEGSLVEVSCRTSEGRSLLTPSPAMNALILGVLGRAQRRYSVAVYAFSFLSNHYHLLIGVSHALQLARFMGFLNSNLARKAARLVGRVDHFWGQRYAASLVSAEEEAQVGRLLYLMSQGVKEGLVAHPLDWPGCTSWPALLDGESPVGIWTDQTTLGIAERRGKTLESGSCDSEEAVVLSPLPAWAHLTREVRRERLRDLLTKVAREGEVVARDRGCQPWGAEAALRARFELGPVKRVRPSGPPLVHAVSRALRRYYREAYRLFENSYRRAADALRRGIPGVPFPRGCFPPPTPFLMPVPT